MGSVFVCLSFMTVDLGLLVNCKAPFVFWFSFSSKSIYHKQGVVFGYIGSNNLLKNYKFICVKLLFPGTSVLVKCFISDAVRVSNVARPIGGIMAVVTMSPTG